MGKRYDEEFRMGAIKLVREEGVPVSRAASDLGISAWTLSRWLSEAKGEGNESLMESEREELKRLRRENQQLRLERDILKKATAYFAKIAP
ncbi:MAG: transposase [Gemmataceae bacterium]|nr:transposase [Gemmataceae bacterium]